MKLSATAVLGVVCLSALWAALLGFSVGEARQYDFSNLYAGASLAAQGRFPELHDLHAQLAEERKVFPDRREVWPYVRPAFHALLIAPLAALPFETAHLTWTALWSVVFLAFALWTRRLGPDYPILAVMFAPVPLGIAFGQDAPWVLCALWGCWVLHSRGRLFAAGAVLALGLAKFHLLLLWPVVLLAGGMRRTLGGFLTGALALAALSALLGGTTGARAYVDFLLHPPPGVNLPQSSLVSLGYFWANGPLLWAATAGLAIVIVAAARRAEPWAVFSLAAAGSLLGAPHAYGYDAALLALPLLLAYRNSKSAWTRSVAVWLCTPLPWMLVMVAPAFAAVRPLSLMAFCCALAVESLRSAADNRAERVPSSAEPVSV